MAQTPLQNQIITWLKTYPYWLQHAGKEILEKGAITPELVEATYKLFKEDNGLTPIEGERPDIEFIEITTDAVVLAQPLALKSIKDIEHVNALAGGQAIAIGSNLTLIYGGNGAGKSGYIRMLNKAFDSRGDQNILPNVYDSNPAGTPACTFVFTDGTDDKTLLFPTDGADFTFQKFAIFDSKSVQVHLEGENKLKFTPCGFEFFELLEQLYEALKGKLQAEITLNRPPNPHLLTFEKENAVRDIVLNLGATTDEEALKKLAGLSQEEAALFTQLNEKIATLRALDIPVRVNTLQDLKTSFNDFIGKQKLVLNNLNSGSIAEYKGLIDDYKKFTDLVTQEGIAAFEQYNIAEIGSPEWQSFVRASKDYADHLAHVRGDQPYPRQDDHCLLCLRPLGDNEKALFEAYWKLLQSQARGELNRINGAINEKRALLMGLSTPVFDESTVYFNHLNSINPQLAQRWKEINATANTYKKNAIENLEKQNLAVTMQALAFNIDELKPVVEGIQSEIDRLLSANTVKEIADLEQQTALLADRHILGRILKTVLELIASYKWAAKAEIATSAFNTTSITKKQGDLFGEHINEKYTTLFNSECENLRAPKVVDIVQKNAKIASFRKLQIKGAAANRVLSEGEQRAISLADFLTEAQLNPNNKGVFFDDPVTSQDHERRERIADRLVTFASDKQVVVFTHDIVFFLRLQSIAKRLGVGCLVTTIRNIGGMPGIIKDELPLIAQNLGERIKYLRNALVKLKSIETSDPDEYLVLAKIWYQLYREGWERAVEERLFKGVIERFGPGIQTQKLKKIDITADMLRDVETAMTDSSNWVHDMSPERNLPPPDTTQVQTDLDFLDAFAKKCAAP